MEALREDQRLKLQRWARGMLFKDFVVDESVAEKPLIRFTTCEPRKIKDVQSVLAHNFKHWSIALPKYKRGTVAPMSADEYLTLGVNPDLESFAHGLVEKLVEGAVAEADARQRSREMARRQREAEASRRFSARAMGPCFRALAENVRQARARNKRLLRVIEPIQKRIAGTTHDAFQQLRANVEATKKLEVKQRAEKVAALQEQLLKVTGVHRVVQWPKDLSKIQTVWDVPELHSVLPPRA